MAFMMTRWSRHCATLHPLPPSGCQLSAASSSPIANVPACALWRCNSAMYSSVVYSCFIVVLRVPRFYTATCNLHYGCCIPRFLAQFLRVNNEPVSYTHLRAHETDSYLV